MNYEGTLFLLWHQAIFIETYVYVITIVILYKDMYAWQRIQTFVVLLFDQTKARFKKTGICICISIIDSWEIVLTLANFSTSLMLVLDCSKL